MLFDVSKEDLVKIKNGINKLIGEEYFKSIEQFDKYDMRFIEDYMFAYDDDIDKVVECYYNYYLVEYYSN